MPPSPKRAPQKLNVGWAEQSEAQQYQNVGLHCIQPNLPLLAELTLLMAISLITPALIAIGITTPYAISLFSD